MHVPSRGSALIAAAVLMVLAGARVASAATGDITEYHVTDNSYPSSISPGPDGSMWFTEAGDSRIGKITPEGTWTEYPVPSGGTPYYISAGPDGNMWFVEQPSSTIGRITTSGAVTEFPLPNGNSHPRFIVAGPDGNLWFTEVDANSVGKMDVNGNLLAEYQVPTPGSRPAGIMVGPDNNLWFTETVGHHITRLTTGGVFTQFPIPYGGSFISDGPGGTIGFTTENGHVGYMSLAGDVTIFTVPTPDSHSLSVTLGGDGNLWFTERAASQIGRMTPSGVFTEFATIVNPGDPYGIGTAADGDVWYTATSASVRIGRIEVDSSAVYPVATNSRQSFGNSSAGAAIPAIGVPAGDTLTVTVATGTFPGPVSCSDTQGNTYGVVADQNSGHGRLFVCAARISAALGSGDTVTASYPGFSGLSLVSVNGIPAALSGFGATASSTAAGNSASPYSGPVTTSGTGVVFGAVANGSTPTFTAGPGFTLIGQVSAGTGSGRKTLSPEYVSTNAVGTYSANGSLSGGQFWQATGTVFSG